MSQTDSPPSHIFEPHQLVAGRFRILRFIAQGGMGEVYEAEDQTLRVHVALKTIRREITADPAAIERFRREMLLARQVTHPNICRLFDVFVHRADSADEILFLTMELLTGRTLADHLAERGPMPESEALPLVHQLVLALDAAHEAGVVHRDFKTANVMLTAGAEGRGTRAVVTDFGLARSHVTSGPSDNSLTGVAAFFGTPAYMAPEQIMGDTATPVSDIYALGIVMYEIVTGSRPFTGDSPLSIATKRLQETPLSPRVHVPDLGSRWEQVILKCLERRPDDRYRRAHEVIDALTTSVPTAAPRTRVATRLAVAASLIVALLVAGFFAARWLRQPRTTSSTSTRPTMGRKAVAVLGFRNLSGNQQSAWISTALAEMLTTELSTGGTLRTIPGETVARMKREFSLADTESFARDTLVRIHDNLGTDVVVLGSYLALPDGQIRLDLRLQDAAAGETLFASAETGTESGLFNLVARAGAALRRSLGVAELQAAAADSLRAGVPANTEAQKLYSEGLARFRLFDAIGAKALLERAIVADPGFSLAHSALSDAWARLGYQANAREEAKKSFDLSRDLSREDRLVVEARYRAATLDWVKAAELYRTLFAFFPDNIEYGLQFAGAQIAQQKASDAFVTIDALKQLARTAGDPRIDLAEADAASSIEDYRRMLAASERAVAGATTRGATLLLAQARMVQGSALIDLGESQKARTSYAQARDAFAAAGDRGRVGLALNNIGNVDRETGDLSPAREKYEQALAVFREIGARRVEATALGNIGLVAMDQGDLTAAINAFRDSLRIAREVDDRSGVARHLNNLAAGLGQRGDLTEAQTTLAEALQLARANGNKNTEAVILIGLGDVLLDQGRLADAQSRFDEGLAIHRKTGSQRFAAYALFGLGNHSIRQDRLVDARAKHDEALSIRKEIQDPSGQAESRLALARLSAEEDQPAVAESLAREAAQSFGTQKLICSEAEANAVLAKALVDQGKLNEGRQMIPAAQSASTRCQNPRIRIHVALARARIQTASGDFVGAATAADTARAEARRRRLVPLELEAELALARVEIASGRTTAAAARLAGLEKQAAANGFTLIARQARAVRGG